MQAPLTLPPDCPLFDGIEPDHLRAMLGCLCGFSRCFERGETIYSAGATTFSLGVVLSGIVDIVQEDYWGNRALLSRLEPGDLFAESFVLARSPVLPVTVQASRASTILTLDYGHVLTPCKSACPYHSRLIGNLLSIVAKKNMMLTRKMDHITRRTMREKLLAFLSDQARLSGSSRFTIPFDRQALADYLAVDRSALSRELSRMQREGLLTYDRDVFTLAVPQ